MKTDSIINGKKIFLSLMAAAVFAASFALMAPASMAADFKDFKISFGTSETQVMYYNHRIEGFEEPYSMGPSDFCVMENGAVAVLDTFNNSVKVFGADAKLLETVNVLELVKKELATSEIALSAMAFVKYDPAGSEFYAADAISSKIFHISGKKLVKSFGARGEKAFEFVQLEQLFRTPSGLILACDYAKNKVAVFSAAGEGVKEFTWNLCSIFADDKYIYSINPQANKALAFYRQEIETGASSMLFAIQVPHFRIAKIIGSDKAGNITAAFFDDSIQPRLMQENKEEYPAGYYTVAAISANGQIIQTETVPVCAPLGNQFYYSVNESKAYYQNYNSDRAPEGEYKISPAMPGFAAGSKIKAASPENITPLKKAVTKIEYGAEANKISGSRAEIASKLPVLRCDKAGYFYILDRIAGRVICVNEEFTSIKAVEIAKNIKQEGEAAKKSGRDFCDMYAVSSSEIFVLDSINSEYFHIKASARKDGDGGKTEPAYDIKVVDFADESAAGAAQNGPADKYDRIFANSIGDVMLYSSIDGDAVYFDEKGGEKKALDSIAGPDFFTLTNSDIVALAQNETSGEAVIKYMDFYGNIMKRFEKDIVLKAAKANITAAHVLGADGNTNLFLTYFDGDAQKIALYSVTGDKICEFDFTAPQHGRYFETSAAAGANGTLYLGMPMEDNYYVIKIPYSSVIEHITKK